ncbi:hypothetical protein [Streptomyces sp. URMC 129]|uniref:hypothetical protein n=1 Tax=Streptomyces sp. URMC 129 TaxID=3423407 RepID=UPI003F195B1F
MTAPGHVVSHADALRQARAVLDAAREQRDRTPIREWAEHVAAGDPSRTAEQVETALRRLHAMAAERAAAQLPTAA